MSLQLLAERGGAGADVSDSLAGRAFPIFPPLCLWSRSCENILPGVDPILPLGVPGEFIGVMILGSLT